MIASAYNYGVILAVAAVCAFLFIRFRRAGWI